MPALSEDHSLPRARRTPGDTHRQRDPEMVMAVPASMATLMLSPKVAHEVDAAAQLAAQLAAHAQMTRLLVAVELNV